MYRGHTVGVVVPAYNEAGFVGGVIESMPAFVDRVYAVDDCSTDGTWAEIRRHARTDDADDEASPQVADGGSQATVVPIRHDRNRGAGGAIKTGYRRALAEEVDLVVTMDADGQMDPALLPRLLDPLVAGEADYAKGDRLATPAHRREMPRFRRVGNWLLTLLTKVASGYWGTRDPQNGYTAITAEALAAVDLDALYEYYGYCNHLLAMLNVAECRVVDVPMPATYGDERSSIRYRDYVPKVSTMLLSTFLWRLRRKYLDPATRPVTALYGVGALGLGVGALALLGRVAGGTRSRVTTRGDDESASTPRATATDPDAAVSGEAAPDADAAGDVAPDGGPSHGRSLLLLALGAACLLVAAVLDVRETRDLEVRKR